MDVNPKAHAQKKRWRKYASQRDYRYGGKIGGHSVNRFRRGRETTQHVCEERLEITSYSEQDDQLADAGIRLPVEKALGCRVKNVNKLNYGKVQKVKEILENSGATTKVSTLQLHDAWSGRATVKKTWYAMPLNKDDTNGMVAHAQQKNERAVRKMLADFGIKMERERVSSRVNLTRFLPHGEIYRGFVPCVKGDLNNATLSYCKMGLAEIRFTSPMKVVGIGFRALKVQSLQSTRENPVYVMVAPVCSKVQYQTFNSNTPAGEWTGTKTGDGHHTTAFYRGPKDYKNEVAHKLDISNCKSLKVEAMSLTVWGGTLGRDVPVCKTESRWKSNCCFEVFVYGSAEPREEEDCEEDQVPVGSGCIKNDDEVSGKVTVICHTEAETVALKWTLDKEGRWRSGWYYGDEKREKIHTDEDFCIRQKDGN